jgi:hypothetical protein
MSYIGNSPTQSAFVTDLFNGDGSTTAFTMSVSPANPASILIAVSGVLQSPDTYSVSGQTLNFSAAPPSATGNISVRYLGIPASGVTTTAYRTITEYTATAGQTTFTSPSYTVGFINVFRNGVMLGSADYTATNGISVVLASGASSGDLVTIESFYVSSVLNAIPSVAGAVTDSYISSLAGSKLTGTQTIPKSTLPTGSVLQVVTATKTDTFSSSANATWTDITGLSASITPTSSSSRILVMAQVYASSRFNSFIRMVRGSTAIFIGDAAGVRPQATTGSYYTYVDANISSVQPIIGLDFPATTSSTTYKIQFHQVGSGAQLFVCNRSQNDTNDTDTARGYSSITLMEIAA